MATPWQTPTVTSFGTVSDLTLQSVGKQDPGIDLAQSTEGHCEQNGGGAAGCIDNGGGSGTLF